MAPLTIAQILILATITEAVTEYLFSSIPTLDKYIKYFAVLVGVVIAFSFNADLFASIGLTAVVPVVSKTLTGILISRGAGVVNDLLSSLYSFAKKREVKE